MKKWFLKNTEKGMFYDFKRMKLYFKYVLDKNKNV